MKRNRKALLWVIAVFAVLSVGLYIGGCGEDEETADAGTVDAGTVDAGSVDAGTVDAGTVDAGSVDAGTVDAGTDAGVDTGVDAGIVDPCEGKQAGDRCPGGFCIEKVGGGLECAKECTVVGVDSSCGEGKGCYLVGANKVCLKGGDRKVGEACGVANDCEVGAICLDNEGLKCWLVCSKDSDCSGGTCTDTNLGFNVCVAD